MFESDTEILLSDNDCNIFNNSYKTTKKSKSSKYLCKNIKKNKNLNNIYFLLCIDWDMTIINKDNIPFPSVKWFFSKLPNLWPNIYIVINTLANEKHIEYTMPDFLKSKYDYIIYNTPKKPLNTVRRAIPKMEYLNGFTGLLDDNCDNNNDQFDIFIDVSLYHMRDKNQKIIDVDYKKIYILLTKQIKEFLKTKK